MVFAHPRCLLAVNSAVNKEGQLCAGAANSNVRTYVFPPEDIITNNCVGKRVPTTLIKEGTASKHVKGIHSNKGQIGVHVYKKSIICFECCRAPKLPSTQQAFMRLQYVFTISVGLCAVLDWFLIVATIVIMWSATVPC